MMRLMRDDRFEQLYTEHAQGLFGFLSYRTGDHVLAEDLLADTFERALRARRRFDPREDLALCDRAQLPARSRPAAEHRGPDARAHRKRTWPGIDG
jgi:Sigma-70 region 2